MKLSAETVKILKNHATINNNMIFNKGNTLRTFSSSKIVFSIAKIEEEIPINFALYDLPGFLAMFSCLDDPDIIFKDSSLEIRSASDKGMFEIFYSDSANMVAPPLKDSIPVDEVYRFKLTNDDLQTLMKAIAVAGSTDVIINCKKGVVTLKAGHIKNNTHSSYSKILGNFDHSFEVCVDVENLKLIPDGYDVLVACPKGKSSNVLHFKADTKNVEYWISCKVVNK